MLVRKPKNGTGIGLRWSHGCSPPRRGSPRGAWLWIVLRQRHCSWGSRGLAPLDCLHHRGRVGVTLAISTPAQKNRGDFPSKLNYSAMIRVFLNTPPFTMICRRPRRVRRISNKQFKKNLPAVPLRGHEAGIHRIHYDFHDSGVSHIDSCLFLQSQIILNN